MILINSDYNAQITHRLDLLLPPVGIQAISKPGKTTGRSRQERQRARRVYALLGRQRKRGRVEELKLLFEFRRYEEENGRIRQLFRQVGGSKG